MFYLQISAGGDCGNTLQQPVVAAARTSLHLHTGRPQHEVGIPAIEHGPCHLHHLRANFTCRLLGWLCLHWWGEIRTRGIFGRNDIRCVERQVVNRCGNLPRLLVYRPWVWSVRVSCSSSSSSSTKNRKGVDRLHGK